jgi:hypothetical protein
MGRWTTGLADDLGYKEIFLQYAQTYHELGWALTALNSRGAPELEVDGGDSQNNWLERLDHLITGNGPINLGVRTGRASRLMVLEVTPEGKQLLDRSGPWRSSCVAQADSACEHHYFTLPQGYPIPHNLTLPARTVKVFGEGGMVLAPPSFAPDTAIPWRWLSPPWESPPGPPSPAIWQYLGDILTETRQLPRAISPQPPAIEWGQYPLPKNVRNKGLAPEDVDALEYLKELTFNLYRQLHDSPKVAAFNAALREHLEENPELAADLEKVEMLQYCLYTYCRINPDFADFTPRDRVKEASKMACEFLSQLARYMQDFMERRARP